MNHRGGQGKCRADPAKNRPDEKQGNEVYYRITDVAVQGVRYWQETLRLFRDRIPLQTGDWDGVWSLLHIVPAGDKKDTNEFTGAVRQAGYGSLGGSLWISPHDLTGLVRDLAEKYGVAGGVCQFRGRMAGDVDAADIATRVWPVEILAQRYRSYGQLLGEEAVPLDSDSFDGGGGLPFLHRYGLDLFEIIQDDPQLPLKLLPSGWPGLQAAGAFLGLRESILPKANGFISQVLAE